MVLLAGALAALGVWISSLFNNQIAAFATTMGVFILVWWILSAISQTGGQTGGAAQVVGYLDFSQHYFNSLIQGVMDLKDIIFYLSAIALSLFLGTVTVETRRWR
jgi:ABC-2 type transport system permease protein